MYASPASVAIPAPIVRAKRNERDSHAVTCEGSTVIVHDVEVYGEVAKDEALGVVDEAALGTIATNTNARIAAGQHPQIVLEHAYPGSNDKPPPDCVGRIVGAVRVSRSPATGKAAIFADMEFRSSAFEEYIASNRWPRRSAEVVYAKKPGVPYLHQVALLGRAIPRIDMPDVTFNTDARPLVVRAESDVATQFSPEKTMNPAEVIAYVASLSATDKANLLNSLAAPAPEPKAAPAAPADPTGGMVAQFAEMSGKLDEIARQNAQLVVDLNSERTARVKSEMSAELARLSNVEGVIFNSDEELAALVAMPDAEARAKHVERIAKFYQRRTTGTTAMNASGAVAHIAGSQRPAGAVVMFGMDHKAEADARAAKIDSASGGKLGYPAAFAQAIKELGFDKLTGAPVVG